MSVNGRPQTVIVKLLSFKDRKANLNQAKDRKVPSIYIKWDFSKSIPKICRELQPQLQKLKSDGLSAYLSYNKIRIRKDQFGVNGGGPQPQGHGRK